MNCILLLKPACQIAANLHVPYSLPATGFFSSFERQMEEKVRYLARLGFVPRTLPVTKCRWRLVGVYGLCLLRAR